MKLLSKDKDKLPMTVIPSSYIFFLCWKVFITTLYKFVESTGEIFPTMMDAARWCGLSNSSSIGQCCMGHQLTAGKHPITKERLKWKYLDE